MGAGMGKILQSMFAGDVGGTGGEGLLKLIDVQDGGSGATICIPDSVNNVSDNIISKMTPEQIKGLLKPMSDPYYG